MAKGQRLQWTWIYSPKSKPGTKPSDALKREVSEAAEAILAEWRQQYIRPVPRDHRFNYLISVYTRLRGTILVLRNLRLSRAECTIALVRDLLRTVGAGWRQAVQSCLHVAHGSVVADRSGLTALGVHHEDSRERFVSSVISNRCPASMRWRTCACTGAGAQSSVVRSTGARRPGDAYCSHQPLTPRSLFLPSYWPCDYNVTTGVTFQWKAVLFRLVIHAVYVCQRC